MDQPTPANPAVLPVTPICSKVSPRRFNRALRIRRQLGGNRHPKFAHSPVCVRPRYAKVRRDIRNLRRCDRTPKCFARRIVVRRWNRGQWPCLKALWGRESHWRVTADNPSSDAYGIPQALPGHKMGPGWQHDHRVQIRWGLGYVAGRYGTPCNANAIQSSQGWY